jgi:hypothetical protein
MLSSFYENRAFNRLINTVSWSENRKGVDHSEDLVVDEWMILERILKKYGRKFCTGFIRLRRDFVNTVMNRLVP